jgi:hypothetical protein
LNPGPLVVVLATLSLVSQEPNVAGDAVVVRGYHPTLAGGDCLRGVEREATCSERPDGAVGAGCSQCLRLVLDDHHVALGDGGFDLPHVGRITVEVHGQDCTGRWTHGSIQ